MKITYKKETKKTKPPQEYEQLVSFAKRSFQDLPEKFSFYYQDQDGDIISIDNQDGWAFELQSFQENQAQSSMMSMKLVVAANQKDAIEQIEANQAAMQDTMRMSYQPGTNQNMSNYQQQNTNLFKPPEDSRIINFNVPKVPPKEEPILQQNEFVHGTQDSIQNQNQLSKQQQESQNNAVAEPNPNLMQKVSAFNQSQFSHQPSELPSAAQFHHGSIKQGFQMSPNNRDISNFVFEEVKSEIDDADKLGVSEYIDNQDLLQQLNNQPNHEQIRQQYEVAKEEVNNFEIQPDDKEHSDIRILEDDDEVQRFDDNFGNLQGRAQRSSTKMVRLDTNYDRSGTIMTKQTDTSVRKVDDFDDFEQPKFEEIKEESPEVVKEEPVVEQQHSEPIFEQVINKELEQVVEQLKQESEGNDIEVRESEPELQKLHTIPELVEEHSSKVVVHEQAQEIEAEQQLFEKIEEVKFPDQLEQNEVENKALLEYCQAQEQEQKVIEQDNYYQDLSNRIIEANGLNNSQSFACFNCQGTKINKKGLQCRKCKGTGQLSSDLMDEVKNILRDEIRVSLPVLLAKVFQNQNDVSLAMSQLSVPDLNNKLNVPEIVHPHTKCIKCGLSPITGARFLCCVCQDLNLCELCEATDNHSHMHAMFKIRNPNVQMIGQKEQPIVPIEVIKEEPVIQEVKPQKEEEKVAQSIAQSQINDLNQSKIGGQKQYKSKLLKESFGDNYTVETGINFSKVWTFRNDGPEAWPQDTRLAFSNGAIFGQENIQIGKEVKPGETVDINVSFTAPKNIGKYSSFYKLCYGEKVWFGQKVYCDIQVVEPEDDLIRLKREMEQADHMIHKPQQVQNPSQQQHQQPINHHDNQVNYQQNPIVPEFNNSYYQQQQQNQLNYNQYPAGQQQQQPFGQYSQYYSNQYQQPYGNQSQYYQQQQQYGQFPFPILGQQQQLPQVQLQPQREGSLVSKEEMEKIDYVQKTESLLSVQKKNTMLTLLDMGFTNFQKNDKLYDQFNGDIIRIADALSQ